jgi:hypothetical protein
VAYAQGTLRAPNVDIPRVEKSSSSKNNFNLLISRGGFLVASVECKLPKGKARESYKSKY